MNIPLEVARAQGHHGIKGGRPRLDLTEEQRAERRRERQETHRRKQGIPPRKTGPPTARRTNWAQEYYDIWSKPPWQILTPEEFTAREPFWNAWVEQRRGG